MLLHLLMALVAMCSAYITIVDRIPASPPPDCRLTTDQIGSQRGWSCTNHTGLPLPTERVQICSEVSGLLTVSVRKDFMAKTIRVGCPGLTTSNVEITIDTIMIEEGSTIILVNNAVLRANVISVGVLAGSGVIQGDFILSYSGSVTMATKGFLVPGGDGIGTLTVTEDLLLDYNSVLGMRWDTEASHDILVVNGELMMACKYCWWLEGDVSQNLTQSAVVQTGSLTCTLTAPLGLPLGPIAYLQRSGTTTPKPGGGNQNTGSLSLMSTGGGKTSLGTTSLADTGTVSIGSTSGGSLVASTTTPDTCSGSIYESLFDPCGTTAPTVTRTCRCVNGNCDGAGVCQCYAGYIGAYCDTLDCPGYPICSDHGSCTLDANGLPACLCGTGWSGPDCSLPVCPAVAGVACSGVGTCYPFDPPLCACPFGYSGAACEINDALCVDCQHGSCSNATCVCESGWTGVSCQLPDCPGTPDCNTRGVCTAGQCQCDAGFTGVDCGTPVCPGASQGEDCSGRGLCLVTDTAPVCVCDSGYTGADCSTRMTTCDTGNCLNGVCPFAGTALTVINCGNTQAAEVFNQRLAGVWSSDGALLLQAAPTTTTSHCFLEFGSAALLGRYVANANQTFTLGASFNFTNTDTIQGVIVAQDPENYWQLLIHPASRTVRVQSISYGILHSYGIRILPKNANFIDVSIQPSTQFPGYHTIEISRTPSAPYILFPVLNFVVNIPDGQVGIYAYGQAQVAGLCITGLTAPPQQLAVVDPHCACDPYYIGSGCNVLDCSSLSYCNNGRGTCALAGGLPTCTCEAGWTGVDCSVPTCPSDCSGHGACRIATAGAPTCDCDPSWNSAADCSVLVPKCPGDCSGNGQCLYDATLGPHCSCSNDWTGPMCDVPVCNGITTSECSGLGVCVSTSTPHFCQCNNAAVSGPNCEYQDLAVLCPDDCNSAAGRGTCDLSNQLAQCVCSPGYEGSACELSATAIWSTTVTANEVATIAGTSRYVVYGGAAGGAALIIIVIAVIGTVIFRRRKADLNLRLQSVAMDTTASMASPQHSAIDEAATQNSWTASQSFRSYAADDEELNFV